MGNIETWLEDKIWFTKKTWDYHKFITARDIIPSLG